MGERGHPGPPGPPGEQGLPGSAGKEGAKVQTNSHFNIYTQNTPQYIQLSIGQKWFSSYLVLCVHREIQVQQGQRVKTDLQDSEGSQAREVYQALW